MKQINWQPFYDWPFLFGRFISDMMWWVTLAVYFCHNYFLLLQSSCYKLYFTFTSAFKFTSETSLLLLSLKCLPSNATKKLLVKIVEHQLLEAFSDNLQRDVQLGRFILLSVPIFQQLLKLTFLYFLSFLKWPLNLDCTFPRQQSSGSEQLITHES